MTVHALAVEPLDVSADALGLLLDAAPPAALAELRLTDGDGSELVLGVLSASHVVTATRPGHRLTEQETVAVTDLLDEPFLALPESAGVLRDYWLGLEHRGGRAIRIGGVVTTAEETFEAVANGVGIALLSAGNAAVYRHSDVVTVPVTGV